MRSSNTFSDFRFSDVSRSVVWPVQDRSAPMKTDPERMRRDGTRRETGAADCELKERTHLGGLSLSHSLSSTSLTVLIYCSLLLSVSLLFLWSTEHVDLLLSLFKLRRRRRRAQPFYSAVNTTHVRRHRHTRAYALKGCTSMLDRSVVRFV